MEAILVLAGALALSSWFWVVFGVAAFFFIGAIADERGFMSTVTTIIMGLLVAMKWPVVIDIVTDPVTLAAVLGGYAVIGVIWARIKWSKFLSKRVEMVAQYRDKFLKEYNVTADALRTTTDQGIIRQYLAYMGERYGRHNMAYGAREATTVTELHRGLAPAASSSKGSIVMWIGYWPISVALFVLRDLVHDLATGLYKLVGGHFQRMADQKFDQL